MRKGSHHAAPGDRHQGLKTVPPTPGHGDGTPTDRLGLEKLKSPVKDSQLKTPKKQFVSPPTSDVSMNVRDESPKVDGDDSPGKAETPSLDGMLSFFGFNNTKDLFAQSNFLLSSLLLQARLARQAIRLLLPTTGPERAIQIRRATKYLPLQSLIISPPLTKFLSRSV